MKKRVLGIIIAVIVVIVLGAVASYWRWHVQKPAKQSWGTQQKQHAPEQSPATSTPTPSYVDQTLAGMSLQDKVASLFVLHVPGTDPAALSSFMTAYRPSGLIFMGDNIPYTFADLQAQTSVLIANKQLPPLIAIDEEGDTVKRLAADTFPGALTLRNQPPTATRDAFVQRSDLLRRGGLNLNFGIIADVTADSNSFIYPRVLGTTPQAVSDRVAQAVAGSESRTLSTIKHFPGHGETGADSHRSVPATTTTYADWRQRVALPFKAGIDAGADLVMFGHLRYSAVDQQPATLSKKWHDVIRDDLDFKGVVITDDMIMLQNSGEAAYADPVANAIAAIQAGNDLLLYVLNHGDRASSIDPNALINGVVAAVNDGRIPESAIDTHVRSVLTLRHRLAGMFYGQ